MQYKKDGHELNDLVRELKTKFKVDYESCSMELTPCLDARSYLSHLYFAMAKAARVLELGGAAISMSVVTTSTSGVKNATTSLMTQHRSNCWTRQS